MARFRSSTSSSGPRRAGLANTPGLELISTSTDADCGDTPTPDTACGIANESGPITVPWDYPDGRGSGEHLLRGRAQPERAVRRPCAAVLLELPREHAHLAVADGRPEGLRRRARSTHAGRSRSTRTSTPARRSRTSPTTPPGPASASFQLDDDGDNANTLKDTKTFTGLTPGRVLGRRGLRWPRAGRTRTSSARRRARARRSTPSGGNTGRTATITLGLAGNVDCTYSNTFTKRHRRSRPTFTRVPARATRPARRRSRRLRSARPCTTRRRSARRGGFRAPTGTSPSRSIAATRPAPAPARLPARWRSRAVSHIRRAMRPSRWAASRSRRTTTGDANYNSADGPCEPLTATKLDSSTVTDIHNAEHGVITSAPIGSTVHDRRR